MTPEPTPSTLGRARLIDLPQREDHRGGLGYLEARRHVPFDIRRVYYLYDIPPDSTRGAHAHKALEQLILAAVGRFQVTLDDGTASRTFELDSPGYGLYVPPMLWRDVTSFSKDAFCLVLASDYYDEDDYFRDYDDYRRARGVYPDAWDG